MDPYIYLHLRYKQSSIHVGSIYQIPIKNPSICLWDTYLTIQQGASDHKDMFQGSTLNGSHHLGEDDFLHPQKKTTKRKKRQSCCCNRYMMIYVLLFFPGFFCSKVVCVKIVFAIFPTIFYVGCNCQGPTSRGQLVVHPEDFFWEVAKATLKASKGHEVDSGAVVFFWQIRFHLTVDGSEIRRENHRLDV